MSSPSEVVNPLKTQHTEMLGCSTTLYHDLADTLMMGQGFPVDEGGLSTIAEGATGGENEPNLGLPQSIFQQCVYDQNIAQLDSKLPRDEDVVESVRRARADEVMAASSSQGPDASGPVPAIGTSFGKHTAVDQDRKVAELVSAQSRIAALEGLVHQQSMRMATQQQQLEEQKRLCNEIKVATQRCEVMLAKLASQAKGSPHQISELSLTGSGGWKCLMLLLSRCARGS